MSIKLVLYSIISTANSCLSFGGSMADQKFRFNRDIHLGHIVQIALISVAAIGGYYGLIMDIRANSRAISGNTRAIASLEQQVSENNHDLLKEMRSSGSQREARILKQMGFIKSDVSWLVRNRGGSSAR